MIASSAVAPADGISSSLLLSVSVAAAAAGGVLLGDDLASSATTASLVVFSATISFRGGSDGDSCTAGGRRGIGDGMEAGASGRISISLFVGMMFACDNPE